MKKYLLSLIVIFSFATYVLFLRHGDDESRVIPPAGLTLDNSSASPTSPADTSSISSDVAAGTPPPANPTPSKTTTPPKTTTPAPTPTPAPAPKPQGQYKDGSYTGSVADAYYGNIQVQATISGGRLTNVAFLQYPNDRGTSIEINTQAMPYLKAEALQVQNANVNIVSGATDSSLAFRESLGRALAQAKN